MSQPDGGLPCRFDVGSRVLSFCLCYPALPQAQDGRTVSDNSARPKTRRAFRLASREGDVTKQRKRKWLPRVGEKVKRWGWEKKTISRKGEQNSKYILYTLPHPPPAAGMPIPPPRHTMMLAHSGIVVLRNISEKLPVALMRLCQGGREGKPV